MFHYLTLLHQDGRKYQIPVSIVYCHRFLSNGILSSRSSIKIAKRVSSFYLRYKKSMFVYSHKFHQKIEKHLNCFLLVQKLPMKENTFRALVANIKNFGLEVTTLKTKSAAGILSELLLQNPTQKEQLKTIFKTNMLIVFTENPQNLFVALKQMNQTTEILKGKNSLLTIGFFLDGIFYHGNSFEQNYQPLEILIPQIAISLESVVTPLVISLKLGSPLLSLVRILELSKKDFDSTRRVKK